jgi:hypothetical protein
MHTNPELAARFVEALSAENIEKQRRHEYHQGHPTLTEAELDIMMAADKKHGRPMGSLAQAKKVLADPPPGTGILRPGLVRPTGERLRTLWLIGIALAESLNQPRVPKEGETAEPAPPIAAPGYRVFVDDNFHFRDEDERYEIGVFGTVDEAIAACKRIVDRYLEPAKPGTTAAALYADYVAFGEDPYIKPVDPAAARVTFSAWDYAKERCQVLAQDRPAPYGASDLT